MTWVKGLPGSVCPEDGFYCEWCVLRVTVGAERDGTPAATTGPMLGEILERRELGQRADWDWPLSLLETRTEPLAPMGLLTLESYQLLRVLTKGFRLLLVSGRNLASPLGLEAVNRFQRN